MVQYYQEKSILTKIDANNKNVKGVFQEFWERLAELELISNSGS